MQNVCVIINMPFVLSLGLTSLYRTHKHNDNLGDSPLHLKADDTLLAIADRS